MANYSGFRVSLTLILILCFTLLVSGKNNDDYRIVDTPADGRIIENIPPQFKSKYAKWKTDLLSTDFGKTLWSKYQNKKDFILTIVVADKSNRGAGTFDYKWNRQGQLVGATILLGGSLDRGFPDPSYYPVMNSLSEFTAKREIGVETLAASKFAHEFGHVNHTLISNFQDVETQNRLMPVYNEIFLSNGYNLRDDRLLELASKMGGTPNQIWENREYWGETAALEFLVEKVGKRSIFCAFISKVNTNVKSIAQEYESRFRNIAEANFSVCN